MLHDCLKLTPSKELSTAFFQRIAGLGRYLSQAPGYDGRKLNRIMSNQRQLELGFAGARAFRLAQRQQRRPSRAHWWFQQMRQVVDQALDWQAVAPGRPEQTWMELSRRAQGA